MPVPILDQIQASFFQLQFPIFRRKYAFEIELKQFIALHNFFVKEETISQVYVIDILSNVLRGDGIGVAVTKKRPDSLFFKIRTF